MHADVASWLNSWLECYGPFPDDYLVLDTETTGLDRQDDLIVQLGYCRVRRGMIVENCAFVLDWTRHPLDQDWLRGRLEATAQRLHDKGRVYDWTYDRLANEGVSPTTVLTDLVERLNAVSRDGITVVAHNGIGFDIPMVEAHMRRFLARSFYFPKRVWDTGAMEKAQQLNLRPGRDESAFGFGRRVLGIRSTVKWSLDRHAVPRYGLEQKHNLDLARCHTADYDAYVTSLLLEEYRQIWLSTRPPLTTGVVECSLPVSTSDSPVELLSSLYVTGLPPV